MCTGLAAAAQHPAGGGVVDGSLRAPLTTCWRVVFWRWPPWVRLQESATDEATQESIRHAAEGDVKEAVKVGRAKGQASLIGRDGWGGVGWEGDRQTRASWRPVREMAGP